MEGIEKGEAAVIALRIRNLCADDIAELDVIVRQSSEAAQWSPSNAPEGSEIFVAEHENCPVGFAVLQIAGQDAELLNMATSPDHRRRGVGSYLLTRVLERAQQAGASRIFLEVRESNRAAQGLYSKAGFELAGQRSNYYQDPPEDALILSRSLHPD